MQMRPIRIRCNWPTAFDVVIVNGKIAREFGQLSADLSGRVLKPNAN